MQNKGSVNIGYILLGIGILLLVGGLLYHKNVTTNRELIATRFCEEKGQNYLDFGLNVETGEVTILCLSERGSLYDYVIEKGDLQ
jgi:hypothetical protein